MQRAVIAATFPRASVVEFPNSLSAVCASKLPLISARKSN
jgi:hypothetical protein